MDLWNGWDGMRDHQPCKKPPLLLLLRPILPSLPGLPFFGSKLAQPLSGLSECLSDGRSAASSGSSWLCRAFAFPASYSCTTYIVLYIVYIICKSVALSRTAAASPPPPPQKNRKKGQKQLLVPWRWRAHIIDFLSMVLCSCSLHNDRRGGEERLSMLCAGHTG